jgi:uncharacterized protein YjlB
MVLDDSLSLSDSRGTGTVQPPQVIHHLLLDDGTYPNNPRLPLLSYQGALRLPQDEPAAAFEALFRENRWGASWRNEVYGFQHYHSTAHEVLGVYGGTARVQFGGDGGVVLEVQPGDVVLIPAGVAHMSVGSSSDFRVVGAYPHGQQRDMNYGRAGERPRTDDNIAGVPLPEACPVYGSGGPLREHWR